MKRNSILLVFTQVLLFSFMAGAQQSSVTGVWYLAGVMETASGIKLDEDSTFEFFFSQGALDRMGKGRWKLSGDSITLYSEGDKPAGFGICKSEKRSKKNVTAFNFVSENEYLLSFIHVSVTGTGQQDFFTPDENGNLEFKAAAPDTAYIYFELCPEQIFVLPLTPAQANYYQVKMNQEIFDVWFDNIVLHIKEGYLSGMHPLLEGDSFNYTR